MRRRQATVGRKVYFVITPLTSNASTEHKRPHLFFVLVATVGHVNIINDRVRTYTPTGTRYMVPSHHTFTNEDAARECLATLVEHQLPYVKIRHRDMTPLVVT